MYKTLRFVTQLYSGVLSDSIAKGGVWESVYNRLWAGHCGGWAFGMGHPESPPLLVCTRYPLTRVTTCMFTSCVTHSNWLFVHAPRNLFEVPVDKMERI